MQRGREAMDDERQDSMLETTQESTDFETQCWRQRCDDLARVCEATAWSADPDLVYQRMTDVVTEILRCDQTHMHLITVNGDRFIKRAYHAENFACCMREEALPATTGRTQWMMKTHQPIVMDYEHPHCEDRIPAEALASGFKSAVSIPLLANGELVGMCSVVYTRKMDWSADGLAYLIEIGRVLGVAIKRMQVTKKATELQLLDERKRLSSEIHDNVSQLIGTLSLSAAAALASYDAGDDDAVRCDLERLEETGSKVMRILRDEMLSLRIPLERTDGLIMGMRECLRHFEANWNIPVDFQVRVSNEPLVVSLQTSLQLTRILNECLSNVLKHAEATSVRVAVEESARCLTMSVEDDGRGFDPQAVSPERLGLKIMHERTAAAGGTLTIISGAAGTTVCVDIPKATATGKKGPAA